MVVKAARSERRIVFGRIKQLVSDEFAVVKNSVVSLAFFVVPVDNGRFSTCVNRIVAYILCAFLICSGQFSREKGIFCFKEICVDKLDRKQIAR